MLLPFCLDEQTKKFDAFWHTILPGSKRLMTADGHWHGGNTDVRAAAEDELWQGGFFGKSGGSTTDQLEPVSLRLDGVFFADGGFAGPNQLGSWESTTFAAEAYLVCAKLAREAREKGASPDAFFARVKEVTGYKRRYTAASPDPSIQATGS